MKLNVSLVQWCSNTPAGEPSEEVEAVLMEGDGALEGWVGADAQIASVCI